MSNYLGVTCKKCGKRFGRSLVGRSIFKAVKCPYCGNVNFLKEAHFVLFSTPEALRAWITQTPGRAATVEKREKSLNHWMQ